jgi:esterase/lipase
MLFLVFVNNLIDQYYSKTMINISKHNLKNKHFNVNALMFMPDNYKQQAALLTHGYTSHKASIISWASRLCESGVACVLFDLPGHYLGSYNEVDSFKEFSQNAHYLFIDAYQLILSKIDIAPEKLIFAGHSLGGLLSIKALELSTFQKLDKIAVAVGLGLNKEQETHLFETEIYRKTFEFRNQLVSPAIGKDVMLSWIKQQKEELSVSKERIHIITGQDDIVVGHHGSVNLKNILELNSNDVTLETPKRLSHHMPELAAPHINAFLKKELAW